jgi:hypothetical protein
MKNKEKEVFCQIQKIYVQCGILFKKIRTIRTIRCFFFMKGLRVLTKNINFVVSLCALCVLCGSLSFGEVGCGL